MRAAPRIVVLATFLLGCSGPRSASRAPAAAEREVAPLLGKVREIVTPDGVEALERVQLGGISQWIQIRGTDRKNPVLLFLHGGPGFTAMPASHLHQAPWEEYFTVVHWDQRGAGKTYAENDPQKVAPTMTVDRMVADAEELVAHLRARFGQPKLFLMAHSWGTVLAVKLVQRHPEWFHAYVGVGQVVDLRESERLAYEALLDEARRANDRQALAELESIAPYPAPSGSTPVAKLVLQRKWLVTYGGYAYRRVDDHYGDLVTLSPAYTDRDVRAFGEGIAFSIGALWGQLTDLSFDEVTELGCPVVLFHGRSDLNTSARLAGRWYERLRAPSKKLVWFEHSAHMVLEDEPGRVFLHLVQDVLPLAGAERPPAPGST